MPNYDEITKAAYKEMELYLISSMKRNLGLHIAEEVKTGKDYPQWQALKLRNLRRWQRENKDIVDFFVGSLPRDVADHLEEELKQGASQEQRRFNLANGTTMDVGMDDSFFGINSNKLNALQRSINNDLTNANTAVFRMINDEYRSTIYKYELFLANGVYTPTQAYDAAVKDFLSRGITCIEYKDGRRVNIADYTDMAVRTASKRAQLMGEGDFRKYIGNPLVIITAHNTTCKLCKPFQNKVLIDDVYSGGTQDDGDYMLLSEAMEYGLFHPRCRHGSGTYYPELEDINHYETPENKLNEYGDADINIAHIDNMIQRYIRLVAGSVDPQNIDKYQAQLDLWEREREKYSGVQTIASDSITMPIERGNSRGNPNAILHFNTKLNNRQSSILEKLPAYDSYVVVDKKNVSMKDLAALTAYTGDEFALFTKGNKRVVIRGNRSSVNIDKKKAMELIRNGYKWSGHTHPGTGIHVLTPSDGDLAIFYCFSQKNMVIYNSKGEYTVVCK